MKLHFWRLLMWIAIALSVLGYYPDHAWWQTVLNTLGVWSFFMVGKYIVTTDNRMESPSWF